MYLSIYALLMTCPYKVKVRSLVALQEQQFSMGHDLASLKSPEWMSWGKVVTFCPIDATSDTSGKPSVTMKLPDALQVPVWVRLYWFFSICFKFWLLIDSSGGFINSIRNQIDVIFFITLTSIVINQSYILNLTLFRTNSIMPNTKSDKLSLQI